MKMEQELRTLKEEIGLSVGVNCTEEENASFAQILKDGEELPENIFQYKTASGERLDSFYKIEKNELAEESIYQYILLKQYKELKIIRGCVVFFTCLAIGGLALMLI